MSAPTESGLSLFESGVYLAYEAIIEGGSPAEAVNAALDILSAYPRNPLSFLVLAETFVDDGRLNEAAAAYHNAITLDKRSDIAIRTMNQKERAAFVSDCVVAMKVVPGELAAIYRRQGRWAACLDAYRIMESFDPDSSVAKAGIEEVARILADGEAK